MPVKLIYSEKFLEYAEPGHPESPERLKAVMDFLRGRKDSFDFIPPVPSEEKDLLIAHTPELVRRVKENDFFDPGTPNMRDIYSCAALSCGAAVQAAYAALDDGPCFSLGRPPGHHAGKNTLGGGCYFNGLAVAVKKVLREKEMKIAVLDIDGHHGNGTEEILREEKDVIYVSLHQSPAFPGTGNVSFGNCHNFPILPGAGAKDYMDKFAEALKIIKDFSPDVLGVSAGFDAHRRDPLLNLPLEDAHYYSIGKELAGITHRIFAVMEGGYNIKTIGNTCYSFINGLARGEKRK